MLPIHTHSFPYSTMFIQLNSFWILYVINRSHISIDRSIFISDATSYGPGFFCSAIWYYFKDPKSYSAPPAVFTAISSSCVLSIVLGWLESRSVVPHCKQCLKVFKHSFMKVYWNSITTLSGLMWKRMLNKLNQATLWISNPNPNSWDIVSYVFLSITIKWLITEFVAENFDPFMMYVCVPQWLP